VGVKINQAQEERKMITVDTTTVQAKQCIGTSALVYCNTKYHKPYLARIAADGEMDWQERVYTGYGKHSQAYYVVEKLQPGDFIQCAGGSGDNKYPFKGKVISVGDDYIEIEELADKAFSNIVAERKNSVVSGEVPITVTLTGEAAQLFKKARAETKALTDNEIMNAAMMLYDAKLGGPGPYAHASEDEQVATMSAIAGERRSCPQGCPDCGRQMEYEGGRPSYCEYCEG
jgi:hypothetical protein